MTQIEDNIKIIIVEDEAINDSDLENRLRDLNFDVIGKSSTVEEAVRLVEQKQPDLVILDIYLKGKFGAMEAAGLVSGAQGIPAVFIIPFGEIDNPGQAGPLHPFGFIQRPFENREIKSVIYSAMYAHTLDLKRRQAEEALQYRIQMEELLSVISTDFVVLSSTEIDDGINRALRKIGQFSATDRSYIFIFSEDGSRMDNTHEWCAAGIEPEIENLKGLPVDVFPWWMEKLKRFEHISIPRVSELPPEAESEKNILEPQNIQSLIVVPLVFNEELVGYMGFDSVRSEKTWAEADIVLLKTVGQIIISAMYRRRFEDALVRERAQLLSIFDSIDEIIYVTDPNTNEILYVNQTLQNTMNKDLIGGICYREFQGFDAPCEFCTNEIILNQKPEPYLWEYYNPTLDKTLAIVDRIIKWPDGRDVRFELAIDITDRKKAEEERQLLQVQLQQAHKMEAVGTLAGGIAHDFNNLLQAINGYTQLLLMGKDENDKDNTKLKAIQAAGERAADLVRQLLFFSRKVEAAYRPVDLNREVEHAKRMLERTIPKMISMELHLDSRLWTINADPIQMEQILLNLGTNAADAMPDGGKLIIETDNAILDEEYAKQHLGARSGNYVLLTVSDTGHGMDKECVAHIFEPFYTTKGIGKGTGLGLASVYGIVKSHDGYIMCYSEVDCGTTFKIYLPAVDQAAPAKVDAVISKPLHGGSETILLVDDEDSIREFAAEVLLEFGYKVIAASSGEEALEIFSNKYNEIDLVIMDIGMPGMGGHKCLLEILQVDDSARILIASGYSINGQVKATLQAGAAGFVGKPYQMNEFLSTVKKVLDEKP